MRRRADFVILVDGQSPFLILIPGFFWRDLLNQGGSNRNPARSISGKWATGLRFVEAGDFANDFYFIHPVGESALSGALSLGIMMFRMILCFGGFLGLFLGEVPAAEIPAADEKPTPAVADEKPTPTADGKPAPAVAEPSTYHEDSSPKDVFRFSFREARWERVLTWFAKKADLTLDLTDLPPGSFNYVDDRDHTVAEALDVLNGYLLPRGYVALRRNQFLVVLKTDNPILPNLIPTIPVEKLDQYGNNELLRVLVPVEGFKPSEVAEQVQSFLGAYGKASPVDASQSVLLQGFGKSLRIAVAILSHVQAPVTENELQFRAFPLEHIPAADAERQIQKLFGLGGTNPYAASIARRQSYYDRRRGGDDRRSSENRGPSPLMQNLSANMKVSSLGRTNSLLVTATPSAVKLVENILQSIDVEQPGGKREFLDDTTPELRVYIVDEADEDDVAETVNAIMPGVVINEDGRQDSIHIYATPKEHKEVEKLINIIDQGGAGGGGVEVIPLVRSDPYMMSDLLMSLFANEDRDDRPVITPEPRTRSLAVRATSSQMAQIKQTLASYGETGPSRMQTQGTQSSRFRKVPVPGGRAEWIARAVKDLMAEDRRFDNPIRVVVPADVSEKPSVERNSLRSDRRSTRNGIRVDIRPGPQNPIPATQFASTQTEPEENCAPKQNDQTGRPRVTIEVQNGELFMYSNDGRALDQVEETIRELMRHMPTRTNWTVFYLQAATAAETAEQLGQLLQDESNPYVGVGLPSSAESGLGYGTQSVRLIPDSRTNAIFISGPESKIDQAERFLKLLDTSELPPSMRERVPRTIAVQHADVNAVADMVRELYKDYMEDPNARRREVRRDGRRSEEEQRAMRVDVERQGDRPQPVGIRLTLTVDARTNELVVSCNESLFRQIKDLVESRDQAAMETRPQIQILTLGEGTGEPLVESLDRLSPKISVGTTSPPANSRSSYSNRGSSRSSSSSRNSSSRSSSFRFDSRSTGRRD